METNVSNTVIQNRRGYLVLRAIHIFPEFSKAAAIDRLREKYDPLFHLIRPHITLVFPFDSDIPTHALEKHVQNAVIGHSPFRIVLQGITGAPGRYLFLNVKVGNDQIIALHDTLYTGLLKPYLNRTLPYVPHLTVGCLSDEHSFQNALVETGEFSETFDTIVEEVVTEVIESSGRSVVELRIPLK
jgi:2'-5' RNA ligase